MSSGLMMSCVRENSPPLELDITHSSGPFSLPEASMSSTGGAKTQLATFPTHSEDGKQTTLASSSATSNEQKRRRFHPLRNLRRIFRRRTITSPADTPNVCLPKPTSSTSEKNLRSSTLSSITSVVSASSPSSPLTHQQLQDAYLSQSLPKSKSAYSTRAEKYSRTPVQGDASIDGSYTGRVKAYDHSEQDAMYTTTSTTSSYHHHTQQRQSFGVAVLPTAKGRNFFAERQKLRSVDASSQNMAKDTGGQTDDCSKGANSSEMTDSQRSLSEGRLVESDFSQDPLSQSHDSVFSESATASSLSIVLKAELADVLRKRRNRPDASDEDLGLPRSPNSPQRHAEHHRAQNHTVNNSTSNGNYSSEISSISWVSTSSTDCDDLTGTSTSNSSAATTDLLRHSLAGFSSFNDSSTDEVDLFSTNWQRLSHNAAKHKMAIRPTKKKGPTRNQRRTLETSIPEANEDSLKLARDNLDSVDHNNRAKTRSLPPGIDAKTLEQHTATENYATATKETTTSRTKEESKSIISTKVESSTEKSMSSRTSTTTLISSTPISESLRHFSTKAASVFEPKHNDKSDKAELASNETKEQLIETAESGFLRRLITRNSKRTIAKANDDQDTADEAASEPKKLQMSTSFMEVEKTTNLMAHRSHKEHVEQTRKDIKGKTGFTAMLSSFLVHDKHEEKHAPPKPAKPKSGPAARQRFLPQEIAQEQNMPEDASLDLGPQRELTVTSSPSKYSDFGGLQHDRSMTSLLSICREVETFGSTSLIRKMNSSQTLSPQKSDHLYERKPKIVGLSAFQQKISRSNDSVIRSSSTDSLEEDELHLSSEQKQRKLVEKSRSFRTYTEDQREVQPVVHNNMPSLPDLSMNLRVPACFTSFMLNDNDYTLPSPTDSGDKSVSLGFEINDNNLMKPSVLRNASTGHLPGHTSNMILTTKTDNPTGLMTPVNVVHNLSPANSCNKNISEIEQNIDLIVKSPIVSVVRRSTNYDELKEGEPKRLHEPTTVRITHEEPVERGNARPNVLSLKSKLMTEDKAKQDKSKKVAERPNVLNLTGKMAVDEKTSPTQRGSAGVVEKVSPTRPVKIPASPTQSNVGGDEKASPIAEPKSEKQGNAGFEGKRSDKLRKAVFDEKISPTQHIKSVFEEKTSPTQQTKAVFEEKRREKQSKAVFEGQSDENQNKAAFGEKTTPTQNIKSVFEGKISPTQQTKAVFEEKNSEKESKTVFVEKSREQQSNAIFEGKTSITQTKYSVGEKTSPIQQTKTVPEEKTSTTQKNKNTAEEQTKPTEKCKGAVGTQNSPMIFTKPLPRPNVLNLSKKSLTEDVGPAKKPTTMSSTKTSPVKPLASPALVAAKNSVKSNKSSPEERGPILSPTATVPLREKSKLSSHAIRHSVELLETKEFVDRSSAPANIANGSPAKSRPTSRRSSCMIEQEPQAGTEPVKVPEFLKIQLNRVDPTRSAKTNVVLAKNVKEIAVTSEHPKPNEDVSTHRFSNESLDIIEKPATPDTEMKNLPSPKSPKSPAKKFSLGLAEPVVLREKPPRANAEVVASDKLSVEERKRLFLTEDKIKTDKRIEEMRSVRKKSINEEVFRKSYIKIDESAKEQQETAPTASAPPPRKEPVNIDTAGSKTQQSTPAGSPTHSAAPTLKTALAADLTPESTVVLRKKSLTSSVASKISVGSSDSTPELMKVFARRSLKIKDEDLQALVEKVLPQNNNNSGLSNQTLTNGTSKKFTPTPGPQQQNVDSDKENQSASEEKLDQLDKLEKTKATTDSTNNGSQTSNGNVEPHSKRNSMTDFRLTTSSKIGPADNIATNGHIVTNNNNTVASKKGFTSPLKKCGFRSASIAECNGETPVPARERHDSLGSHNNNNINTGRTTALERQSLNMNITNASKTIERSATVGEFKGIHQRRAEWEQRVKEALK